LTYNPLLTRHPKYCRMSFNVTQCPACESTFNTNSRVLAAAAGRVRCGACLTVFEAIDNFLIPEESDAAPDQDESVFVGNNPQEFFDPSSFLTRSALSETHGDEPDQSDPIDEKNLHQKLEQSETVSNDFFATVVGKLQVKTEAPAVENKHEREEPLIDQPKELQVSIANESIEAAFEEEILESFITEATNSHALIEDNPADSSLKECIEPETELEPELTNTKESHSESEKPILGPGLSVSFTISSNAPTEMRFGEPESNTPKNEEATNELPIDQGVTNDVEAEFDEDNEKLLLATQVFAAEENAEKTTTESPPTAEPSAVVESVVIEPAVAEPAVVEPITNPTAGNESPNTNSESLINEAFDTPNLAKQKKQASEGVAEEEKKEQEPIIVATQVSASEVDEDSTEAIRSRALEAELSDEEALETIPRENLAALGSMSTPVELIARTESHLVRSTLLILSILLLGGLLSSQYLWQRMELYSQLPQLRPLYEAACTYLNCALPQYTDINSIRSENLTVQTHPTYANGLLVNTVIRNTAAFEQPFPILILSFNSVQNSVIALREFTSAEYLDPGLQSIQAMPVQTPVQIGLAIMDPGPEAVNYTLAFRWP